MNILTTERTRRGLSRREVAVSTGLTEQTIYNAERDPASLHVKTLVLIADFYKIPIDSIVRKNK